jgi:hypothetical protein
MQIKEAIQGKNGQIVAGKSGDVLKFFVTIQSQRD